MPFFNFKNRKVEDGYDFVDCLALKVEKSSPPSLLAPQRNCQNIGFEIVKLTIQPKNQLFYYSQESFNT
jgi:hypothetical protein